MGKYNFGEKSAEYSQKHGREIPVWQSPKYTEAIDKAVEILDSGKYALNASDFWILMNTTKSDKMAYTGLILSHNGCLKINDALQSRFDPSCVSLDKEGYGGALVYSYCNKEQGVYEVGEVSAKNCKNDYPYAMAYKRLFDRVVLKLSKLAYAGIYSDSESDEFAQQLDAKSRGEELPPDAAFPKPKTEDAAPVKVTPCADCGAVLHTIFKKDGSPWEPENIAAYSMRRFNRVLCPDCQKKALKNEG